MSHTIVYDRQFVRLPDSRIIPLALLGPNNVTERHGTSERCVRDWSLMYCGNNDAKIALPETLLMELFQDKTGGPYQEHFRYQSKWVDDAALMRFCKNGIKQALTLEEIRELDSCACLKAAFSLWLFNGECEADGYKKKKHVYESAGYINDSDKLLSFLERAEQRLQARGPDDEIYVELAFNFEKRQWPHMKKEQAGPREEPFYVLCHSSGSLTQYVKKLTARRLQFTYSTKEAKPFRTVKEAIDWLEKKDINRRFNIDIQESSVAYVPWSEANSKTA